ncbi:hydrolase [Pandoraea terrae]|uniref:Hydrolase n=1 Tax=Pandoraea terrae TaxID=1537710 RepID=A0A5E4S689_9BURK|nr:hydrolase [Pandoraea terrae]
MTNPKVEGLTPQNCQLIFIDHQPQWVVRMTHVLPGGANHRNRRGHSSLARVQN